MVRRSIKCTNCGATLPISRERKVHVCEYCGTHNAVPESLWRPEPGPVHPRPAPTTSRGRRRPLLVLVPLLFVLAAGVISLLVSLGPSGALEQTVRGDAAGLVDADAVVPSWEAVDGLRTASNISSMVEGKWRPGARTAVVRWNKVKMDGTQDVENDDEAMISMELYDTTLLENVVPGETSIKGAKLLLTVLQGFVSAVTVDATVTWIDDLVYIEAFPECGLAELRKQAAGAGYPDRGFADVTFPEVPNELTLDGMDFALSFVNPDGDELKEVLAKKDWDISPFLYYGFSVPNLDASDLPRYFSPDDCKPVDVKKLQEKEIEKLRKSR
jgi:hypothetical protein